MSQEDMGLKTIDLKVLGHLAKKGVSTQYEMVKHKVGAESAIWDSVKRLVENKYIEIKREEPFRKIKGKSKKYFGLTFKGLVYALKRNIIKPSEASDARLRNNIKLPWVSESHWIYKFPNILGIQNVKPENERIKSDKEYYTIIEAVERTVPFLFYRLLLMADSEKIMQIITSFGVEDVYCFLVPFAGTFSIYILGIHEDYCSKYVKGDYLYLPDGTVIEQFSKFKANLSYSLKIFQEVSRLNLSELLHGFLSHIRVENDRVYWK